MKRTFFSDQTTPIRKISKTWGYELEIVNRGDYCGKLLYILKGKYGSLHYHLKKTETFYLQSGCVRIVSKQPETGKDWSTVLYPGDSLHVPAGRIHQIIGFEDSELFEFSTTDDPADSYRVSPTCP